MSKWRILKIYGCDTTRNSCLEIKHWYLFWLHELMNHWFLKPSGLDNRMHFTCWSPSERPIQGDTGIFTLWDQLNASAQISLIWSWLSLACETVSSIDWKISFSVLKSRACVLDLKIYVWNACKIFSCHFIYHYNLYWIRILKRQTQTWQELNLVLQP